MQKILNQLDLNQQYTNLIAGILAIVAFTVLYFAKIIPSSVINTDRLYEIITFIHYKCIVLSVVIVFFNLRNKIMIGNTIFLFFLFHFFKELNGTACEINIKEFIIDLIIIIIGIIEYKTKTK